MKTLSGKCGNAGVAVGPVLIWKNEIHVEKRTVEDTDAEIERLKRNVEDTAAAMKHIISTADTKASEILKAQMMMLEDDSFLGEITSQIREQKVCAEYAVMTVSEKKAVEFEQMENSYLRARCADIRYIAGKLAENLTGCSGHQMPEIPSVIYARDITPEDIVRTDRSKVLAFVTCGGSAVSHASILCGTYGIPYLFGVNADEKELAESEKVALDARGGRLILSPDNETLTQLEEERKKEQKLRDAGERYHGKVKVYANIAGPDDVPHALENGAEGVGLFRTEFLYMNHEILPDEEEQFEAYKQVLEGMKGREVIIRTLDLGADKQAKCLNLPHEENPALGHRAIRVCLDQPELFRTQLRALLRAACFGNVRIMLPMIASGWEIDEARNQLNIAAGELSARGVDYHIPPLGIMVETPSAVILSDQLAQKADFFSIGTNDLTQYTLALDRTARNMERFDQPKHEAVLRMIDIVVKNAHTAGIPVGVCGELGGNPDTVPALIKMGVDELSVSVGKLQATRGLLATISEEKEEEKRAPVSSEEEFGAPANGMLIPMEEIPDETFSQGILGKCIGIEPENGNVYAPCSGTVTMVAQTCHAVAIRSDLGNEVLVHVGIDTVKLNGNGFDCRVKDGDHVEKGELLLKADVDMIHAQGLSAMVVLVLTNPA